MKLSLYEFAGLHILMRTIPDSPVDAGRRLCRYWYRESRCQVRTGWQKQNQCNLRNLRLKNSCLCVFVAINPFNLRNLRLINDLRSTKDYVRKNKLFMQNEPNLRKSQMNVTTVITMNYEQMDTWSIRKTKPIQSQFKPNTKPIKAKTNPIQSQFKPKLVRHQRGGTEAKMLRMKINPRPKSLGYYPDCRFFAADLGLNLSCFVGLLFDLGFIFSKKNSKYEKSPIKPAPLFVDLYIVRKTLHLCQGQGIIIVDFRLRIEDKHW